MIVYQMELPKEQDAEAFLKFMREEYLPAVHTGPTRVGQVLGLALWQEDPGSETAGRRFLLHVEWAGLEGEYARIRLNDQVVEGRLESLGVRLHRLGFYREVVSERGEEEAAAG